MKLKALTIAVAGSLAIFACSEGGNQPAPEQPVNEEAVQMAAPEMEAEEEDEFMSIALPSALQLARSLQRAGLHYVADLPNSPENADGYNSSLHRKLNFGVYSADFAYAILNEQSQPAILSLGAMRKVASSLGYPDFFQDGLDDRIKSNIGQKDSLISILAEIQFNNQKYIQRNNMHQDANLIFAGAWLEGMYIGSKIADPQSAPELVAQLAEQALLVEDLVVVLSKLDCADCGPLVNDIHKIYDHFQEKLVDGNIPDNFNFTMEEYAAMQKDISEIRRSYTNG